jgi:hypothetical protein
VLWTPADWIVGIAPASVTAIGQLDFKMMCLAMELEQQKIPVPFSRSP